VTDIFKIGNLETGHFNSGIHFCQDFLYNCIYIKRGIFESQSYKEDNLKSKKERFQDSGNDEQIKYFITS